MFGLFGKKKREKGLFKVQFISSCCITDEKYEFSKNAMLEYYVRANDVFEAGVEFAKQQILSPNICICRISQCSVVNESGL